MAERMSLHCNGNYPLHLGLKGAVLLLLFSATGVLCSQVLVPPRVDAVLGKNITLGCTVQVESNLSLTQSSWERRRGAATVTVAVYNPQFGISVAPEYEGRLSFRSPSARDATVSLRDVRFSDSGVYICKVATFPLGNTQASATVSVMVEPKVYVSAGSVPLLDGGNATLVATCTAERARPAAEVLWETGLSGRSEARVREEPNGTSTTQVRYTWQPSRHAHGHALTCVVRHPALQSDFRIPYLLNVQSAPDIVLEGYHGDWFVGQENVQLQCRANANPPPRHFTWTRLDGEIPEGVEVVNSTLVFGRPLLGNDSGVYRCEVGNDIGLRTRDLDVRIQEPPSTTTSPPTTPAPVPTTAAARSTDLPTKRRAPFTSPTLAPLPAGSLGAVVGGAVGGALFLLLLLVLGGACYRKQHQTFRGDYYTKQYLGPSDMQKDSRPPGGAPQHPYELQEVKGDPDVKPKPADDDVIVRDKDREEWGDTRRSQRDGLYHHGNHNHGNHNHHSPHHHGNHNHHHHHHHSPHHHGNHVPHHSPHHPARGPPMYNNHHAPYLPPTDDCCYDNSPDSDLVSHVDGSVISRREWYV
ncbi:nectin-3-like protein [Anguilla rostrata]|uniref:nectin-3-like protein n=1 Tax=Anguilla rostrata TaxID=7938 RepID=UPI0030CE4C63